MLMINLKLGDIKEKLPKKILDKLCRKAYEDVNLYPQNYGSLISKLAKKHKIKSENIVLVNGVDEGIELISRAFGRDILIFPPTYYEFLDAPRRNDMRIESINCFNGEDYVLKYGDEIKDKSLIFLCNPNNPFGILKKKEILKIVKETKGIVAVDESYIGFDGETVINELEKMPNMLILRSFSKSYSLAGLRIGYIAGKKSLIDEIKKIKLICNVSSVSVMAAAIVMDEENYFKNLIKKIKKNKKNFESFLTEKGFGVIHTHTNNIVLKFPSLSEADRFYGFLKSNGIIVNKGNGISTCGLDDTFIRFAYGTKTQMKIVAKIIKKYNLNKNKK